MTMLTYDAMKLGKWNLADLVPSSTAKEVGGLLSNIESKVSRFEGMRPFLVEIQGLVSQSALPNPRRTTLGVDNGRVAILIAVLEKIVGLNLYAQDIYVNAAGGFKITEPGADLAVLSSLVSSFKNRPITPHTLILGEVGLSGEIRGVNGLEIRVKEAQKMGFINLIGPITQKAPSQIKYRGIQLLKDAQKMF